MSVTSTTVRYNIVGSDNASKAFNSAGKSSGKMATAVSKAANIAKKSAEVIGVAAVAAGVDAIHQAAKFQSSMTLLVTAGGESEKALNSVASGIKKIATQTGTSTEQLAEGMYVIEKAGFRGANGLNVLKVSAQAAKAENVDLSTMTNAVTSAMTSYHLPASKAVTITNEMVAAAGAAKTTMSNYAGALSTVLPIASAAGISFAQVGGAIATLTNHGTSAEEATQELANTIRSLQAPNSVAVNEMAQLGLSSNDVSTKLGKRGLTGTLELLSQTVLKKMGPSGTVLLNTFNASKLAAQDATTMLNSLPPAAAKVAKAYEGGSLSLNGYRQALKKLPADQAALAQQFVTTENKSKGFNSALRSGGQPAQTYTKAIKDMTGGATGLNTVLQLTGDNTGRFNANVKTVTDASKHAGSNISTWAKTQKTFNVQWDRFKEGLQVAGITLGTKLLGPLTTVMSFINNKAIPTISDISGDMHHAFSGLSGVVSKGLSPIKKSFSGFWTGLTTGADALAYPPAGLTKLGVNIRNAFKAIKGDASDFWTGLTTGAAVLAYPPTGLTKFGVMIRDKFFSLKTDADKFWTGLTTPPEALSNTPTGLTKFGSNVRTKLADLGKDAQGFWKNLTAGSPDLSKGSGFINLSKNLGKAISKAVSGVAINVGGGAQNLVQGLSKALGSIDWLSVGAFVGKQAVPFIIGFIANLLDPVTIVKSIAKHPMDWVSALASFLVVGKFGGAIAKVLDRIPILKMFSPLFRGLEKMTGPINDALGRVVGAIGGGFKDAFAEKFPATTAWLAKHFETGVIAPFKSIGQTIYLKALYLGDELTLGIRQWSKQLGSEILDVIGDIAKPFGSAGRWLLSAGKSIVSGLFKGVASSIVGIGRWVSTNIVDPLVYAVKDLFGIHSPSTVFASIGSDLMAGLLHGIEAAFIAVATWFATLDKRIGSYFVKAAKWLTPGGSSVMAGLWNGIVGRWLSIALWFAKFAVRVTNYYIKADTWLITHGAGIMSGLFSGISSKWAQVARWFSWSGARIAGYFKGSASWLVSKGASILGGLWSGVSSRYVAIGKWFGGWPSRAAGYFKGGSTWLYSAGVSIMGGLASGFAAKLEGLKDVFKTPIQWILDNVLNPFIHALGHIPGLGSLEKVNLSLGGGTSNAKNQLDGGTREGGVVARKKGGPIAPHGLAWVGEEGPELIRVSGQAMVYPHQKSLQMAKGAGKLPGFALGGIIEGAKIAGSGALGEAAKAAKAAVSHIPGLSTFQTVADSVINTALGWAQSKLQADQKKANAAGGSASGAHGDMSAHSASAAKAQAYAKSLLSQFGWAAGQMTSLISLWNGESGWNNLAANPTSTAFGIAQFLNGTWAGKKFPKTTNFMQQVYDGFQYIKGSYGTPSKAYSSWLGRSPHWYAKGGKPKANELAWVGEEGPELVKFGGPAEVYPHDKSMVMAKSMGRVAGFATGGKVGSGTKDSAKSYVSHLTAQIKLSSTNADIRKFTAAILDKIAKTKYSAAQRAFLNNYVTDAENAALKKQAGSKSSFGSKLIQGILASFGGSSTTSSINTATASVISRIDQAFTGKARDGLVSYTQRVNVQMEKLATARDKITAKIAAANELSTSVTSGAKDFASFAGLTLGSTKTLSREFRSKLASISNFAKNVTKLKKMGYSSELISQLLAEGIDQAAPLAEQLVKATPSSVRGFNATQRAIDRVSKSLGTVAVNAQFGKSAATNFVASLRSQQASLEKQMRALAKVFAKGVGHAFHLKGYAKGGLAKGLAIVGERGPEIADFGTRGAMITPNLATLSVGGDTAGMRAEMAEIKKLLGAYLEAGTTVEAYMDGKKVTKVVNDQNARTGPGSRVGTRRAAA